MVHIFISVNHIECLVNCKHFMILVACAVNAVVTDVKHALSSMPLPDSQHIAVIVAPSSVNDDNSKINASEMHPASEKQENLTMSVSTRVSQTEETLHFSGKHGVIIEHSVPSSVTENVNANILQSTVTSEADRVLPADDSSIEAGDAKMTQQTALKSEVSVTGEGAAVSITPNDALVNDPDASGSSMQMVAASVDQEIDSQVDQKQQQQEVITQVGRAPAVTSSR